MSLTGAWPLIRRRPRAVLAKVLRKANNSSSPLVRQSYLLTRRAARDAYGVLTGRQLGWMATLRAARWVGETTYEVSGWAYERGYGYQQPPRIEVWAEAGLRWIPAAVELRPDTDVNAWARNGQHDYANTAFVARFDLAALLSWPDDELVARQGLRVRVRVRGPERTVIGPLRYRYRGGSAQHLFAHTFPGGVQIVPAWGRGGLRFRCRRPDLLAEEVRLSGRRFEAVVRSAGPAPTAAALVTRDTVAELTLARVDGDPDRYLVGGEVVPTSVLRPGGEPVPGPPDGDGSPPGGWRERLRGALRPLKVRRGEAPGDEPDRLGEGQRGDEEASEDGRRTGAQRVSDAAAEDDRSGENPGGQPRPGDDPQPTQAESPGDVATAEEDESVAPSYVLRRLVCFDDAGTAYPVYARTDDGPPVTAPDSALLVTAGAGARLLVSDAAVQVLVTGYELEREPRLGLRLRGRVLGPGPVTLRFVSARQELPVELDADQDGRFTAFAPLLVPQWGSAPLPPRLGGYGLRGTDALGARVRVSCLPALTASTGLVHELPGFRLRTQTGPREQLRFRVLAPRRPDEVGSFHQRRLEQIYRTTAWTSRDAVYLESFYGRNATCNPRALDRELARVRPDLPRYWGVVDPATPVPLGSVPVVKGTREWWEARATSRYVIANDWLRRQFKPQPFQVVLQTWHGSMLKRIGLDRPNVPRAKQAVILSERSKWDLLLSQNHHSTEILRTAYAWDRPILEEGYPRNDALSTTDGAEVRARLGIAPEQTAVLYAPTWRENLTGMVTFLDLERLTRDLGPDYLVLLRGHSRTVAYGARVDLPGVLDVTTYPDITELFLAADAMVTDYSSVMFDYSVTRRPMIFFVPDMAEYRDSTRGVYFDLSAVAPGPVLDDQDEVTEAIRRMAVDRERYADLYDRWVQRFNHLDDGRSAERIVAQLLRVQKDHPTEDRP